MKKIEVLGPGCDNCMRLEEVAREAVAMAGVEAEVVKVTDYGQIMAYGIMSTPGLVIDGKVVSYGRIPSAGDIAWLSHDSAGAWRPWIACFASCAPDRARPSVRRVGLRRRRLRYGHRRAMTVPRRT